MTEPGSSTLQGQYAGFVSRLLAYLIDIAIVSATTIVVGWISVTLLSYIEIDVLNCPPSSPKFDMTAWLCRFFRVAGPVAASAFGVAYALFFWSTTGQTPGKATMGVRIVRLDGRPMNLIASVRRLIGYGVSYFTFGIGFLVIAVDDRRQGWHDKLAGTCVVYSWDAHLHPRTLERLPSMFRRRLTVADPENDRLSSVDSH